MTSQEFTKKDQANVALFITQITLIYIVVSVSLLNLTMHWGNQNLWIVILTSCLGYIMPNPRFKMSNNTTQFNDNSDEQHNKSVQNG